MLLELRFPFSIKTLPEYIYIRIIMILAHPIDSLYMNVYIRNKIICLADI